MALSQFEVITIQHFFEENDLTDSKFSTELLDHFCCMVESLISEKIGFHEAFEKTKKLFPEEDLYNQYLKIKKQEQMTVRKKHLTLSLPVLMASIFLSIQLLSQTIPSIPPLADESHVTSSFGLRMHPITKEKKMHKGVDFKVKMGTPVLTTANGKIIKAEYNDGHGNFIVVDHGDGFKTLYANLSKIISKVGEEVKKGSTIGLSGNSGLSTAPHLHYEVIKDGENIDPEAYLKP